MVINQTWVELSTGVSFGKRVHGVHGPTLRPGEGSKPELTSDCPDFVFSGDGRQSDESRRKKSFRSGLSLRCANPSKLLICRRRGRGDPVAEISLPQPDFS